MLIVEGTDSVGKTTLTRKLATKLGLLYQHLGPLPDSWVEQDYISLGSHRCAYDRYHISDIAYSWGIPGRVCKIKNARFLHAALTVRFAAITVMITADSDLLTLRHRDEDQMFDLQTVLRVNEMYCKLAPHYADVYYHATAARPFVPEHIEDEIVTKWQQRQICHSEWTATLKSSR
jgi:thymidylate kinase